MHHTFGFLTTISTVFALLIGSAATSFAQPISAPSSIVTSFAQSTYAPFSAQSLQVAQNALLLSAPGPQEPNPEWQEGAKKMAEIFSQAWQLEIKINHGASNNSAAQNLYGDDARQVEAFGLRLHSGMSGEKLERILRESLRAIAFSKAIMGGALEVPQFSPPHDIVLLHKTNLFDPALKEAVESGGLSKGQASDLAFMSTQSFVDRRGWRTSSWMTEAGHQALVIWDTNEFWLGKDIQPCLLAGHLNWLCMNFFGTSMPAITWRTNNESRNITIANVSVREGALWRSAKTSSFACRTWMKARMQMGESFPYASAIVNELGKVRNESLLKATLVNEYLQCTGELSRVIEATSFKPRRAKTITDGLEISLAKFELEWTEWFMQENGQLASLQSVSAKSGMEKILGHSEGAKKALDHLCKIREQAYANTGIWVEDVNLFIDLSRQAELHARYLKLNSGQAKKWPDAHEEYSDRKGFSPAGAWAGRHGMIDFSPNPVTAIDNWMATFYHRISLLEPGLFGIGFGSAGKFGVLDTKSLVAPYWGEIWAVWPPADAKNMGRKFQPERPSPVFGANQKSWGYPITLQAYWGANPGSFPITMQLYLGKLGSEKIVPCHFITPDSPGSPMLASENAYCLIPQKTLKSKQIYTVVAECKEPKKRMVWSFETGSKK